MRRPCSEAEELERLLAVRRALAAHEAVYGGSAMLIARLEARLAASEREVLVLAAENDQLRRELILAECPARPARPKRRRLQAVS